MTNEKLLQLVSLIKEVVDGPEPWTEKRRAVQVAASEEGADVALEEFAGWFDESDR